jgi:hypothetical protein
MTDKTPEERITLTRKDSQTQIVELRFRVTTLEQRLEALEKHVAWLDTFQEGQVKHMLHDKDVSESAGAEFEPGWIVEENGALLTGIGYTRDDWPITRFYYKKGNTEANLMLDSHGEIKLDAIGLRQFIGAALKVLAVIEGGEK